MFNCVYVCVFYTECLVECIFVCVLRMECLVVFVNVFVYCLLIYAIICVNAGYIYLS